MTKLPAISGQQCVEALAKIGFYVTRQKGSHLYLRRDEPYAQFSVPNHKTIYKGTIKHICRQAGITVDELNALL
ncbi:MAG: type II toxin-antitoxin system HicA family toxin [bacterium]|nr:type II toxin-antitoxin system HicA family toxin [bacterium]